MPSQQLLSEFKIDACKLQVDFPGFDSKEHPLVKVVAIFYVECHQSSIFYLENAFRGGVSGREVSRREMQKNKSKKKTILHVWLLRVVFSSQKHLNQPAVNVVQWCHSLPENRVVILIGWLSKHLHNYV